MSNLAGLKQLIASLLVIKNKAMRKLRISAISFLNTAPLMWDFEHGERAKELAKEFEIYYTVPSLCAEALRKGEADIGIIPAITYQTIPNLLAIPDVAIAARGAVRSILLVSKVPVERIRSVAVDTSSRTSVALLEILFRKGWLAPNQKLEIPVFVPSAPDLEKMLAAHEAALLIGDSALRVDHSRFHVIDLAEVWHEATGKPFVFAFWAIRKEGLVEYGDPARLCSIFQSSARHGLDHVAEISGEWAPRIGVGEARVERYICEAIDYTFGESELDGLEHFYQLAADYGLWDSRFFLEFINPLQDKIRSLMSRIAREFPEQGPPSESEIAPHQCDECDGVRKAFSAKGWKQLPAALIEANFDKLPLLSGMAFHYFLPAYLTYSLSHFDHESLVTQFTIYALAPAKDESKFKDWWEDRLRHFTPKQFAVLDEFWTLVEAAPELRGAFTQVKRGRGRLRKLYAASGRSLSEVDEL